MKLSERNRLERKLKEMEAAYGATKNKDDKKMLFDKMNKIRTVLGIDLLEIKVRKRISGEEKKQERIKKYNETLKTNRINKYNSLLEEINPDLKLDSIEDAYILNFESSLSAEERKFVEEYRKFESERMKKIDEFNSLVKLKQIKKKRILNPHELLKLLNEGMEIKEIAEKTGVCYKTVYSNTKSLFKEKWIPRDALVNMDKKVKGVLSLQVIMESLNQGVQIKGLSAEYGVKGQNISNAKNRFLKKIYDYKEQ